MRRNNKTNRIRRNKLRCFLLLFAFFLFLSPISSLAADQICTADGKYIEGSAPNVFIINENEDSNFFIETMRETQEIFNDTLFKVHCSICKDFGKIINIALQIFLVCFIIGFATGIVNQSIGTFLMALFKITIVLVLVNNASEFNAWVYSNITGLMKAFICVGAGEQSVGCEADIFSRSYKDWFNLVVGFEDESGNTIASTTNILITIFAIAFTTLIFGFGIFLFFMSFFLVIESIGVFLRLFKGILLAVIMLSFMLSVFCVMIVMMLSKRTQGFWGRYLTSMGSYVMQPLIVLAFLSLMSSSGLIAEAVERFQSVVGPIENKDVAIIPSRAICRGSSANGGVPARINNEIYGELVLPLAGKMDKKSQFLNCRVSGMLSKDGDKSCSASAKFFHGGYDWFKPGGTEVFAPFSGTIRRVEPSTDCGNKGGDDEVYGGVVEITHKSNLVVVYGNVDPIDGLKIGQSVQAGETVGKITSWCAPGKGRGSDHVHIEVWPGGIKGDYKNAIKDGNVIDPVEFFLGAGTTTVSESYKVNNAVVGDYDFSCAANKPLELPDGFDVPERDPRLRALLDAIGYAELGGLAGGNCYAGGGWNIQYSGKRFSNNFVRHPNEIIRSGGLASSAAGKFQIMNFNYYYNLGNNRADPSRLNPMAKAAHERANANDFSPAVQEEMAIHILKNGCKGGNVLPLLEECRIADVLAACSGQWASLQNESGGHDHKGQGGHTSNDKVMAYFNARLSYYTGGSDQCETGSLLSTKFKDAIIWLTSSRCNKGGSPFGSLVVNMPYLVDYKNPDGEIYGGKVECGDGLSCGEIYMHIFLFLLIALVWAAAHKQFLLHSGKLSLQLIKSAFSSIGIAAGGGASSTQAQVVLPIALGKGAQVGSAVEVHLDKNVPGNEPRYLSGSYDSGNPFAGARELYNHMKKDPGFSDKESGNKVTRTVVGLREKVLSPITSPFKSANRVVGDGIYNATGGIKGRKPIMILAALLTRPFTIQKRLKEEDTRIYEIQRGISDYEDNHIDKQIDEVNEQIEKLKKDQKYDDVEKMEEKVEELYKQKRRIGDLIGKLGVSGGRRGSSAEIRRDVEEATREFAKFIRNEMKEDGELAEKVRRNADKEFNLLIMGNRNNTQELTKAFRALDKIIRESKKY